jgi:hypothetical protein
MSLTMAQARDETSALFKAAWDLTPYGVVWDDIGGEYPDDRSPWARFTMRHADGFQATLSNVSGQRRWRRTGTVFIQLFAPTNEGLATLDEMAMIARGAFQGKATAGGVWFRNGRVREIGVDGKWQQANVLIDFEYDEVG